MRLPTLALVLVQVSACAALLPKKSSSSHSSDVADPAEEVTTIAVARADGKTTWCAGEPPAKLVVKATLKNGTTKELSSGVTLAASHGQLADGALIGSAATWDALEAPLTLSAKLDDKPAITAELELAPAFDCDAHADVRGKAGDYGQGGNSGPQGSSGDSGRPDGGAGGAGGPGGPGGAGGDAAPVTVELGTLKHGKLGKLVRVRVRAGDTVAVFLRAETAPVLTIDAAGGPGGTGGSGGSGGGGGFGYSENTMGATTPNGRGGNGGPGGNGGNGGTGGAGGSVTVAFDKANPALKDKIAIENGAGLAGGAGSPGGQGHPGPSGSGSQGPSGASGEFGPQGHGGVAGRPGRAGPKPVWKPTPGKHLFAD